MSIESSFAETVIQNFGFPNSTELGVKVPKKTITDNTSLSSSDKQLIKDVLKSLMWRFTMKPETVNIPVFEDDVHQYKEIAVLHVKVKSNSKTKQLCKLLHQQIPYPTLLFVEWDQEAAISLADKRVNQVDSTKLTIEYQYDTGWLDEKSQQTFNSDFLADLRFDHCSVLSLYDFYTSVIQKLNFLEAAKTTGIYSDKADEDLTPLLAELNRLEIQLIQIRNKLKKETQMNTKMRLNVEARKIKLVIEKIKQQIA
ncbi:DUF4391 domain-containing protein [Vibrio ezurae]|uniref:Methyl-accepting chemotaxis protein n=1 Tax=Vibrio ezurae NBRC 102218 TaxID=1219080 RepID=U3B5U0_9VIBR|nr:DUF4391 domain-containing protein [Vibrio ezurae]GAD81290.1 hypothetical protein VEZ01S_55_00060 [Vibrio ezurae NBRC 102218]